jgi:hypothetical protein
MRPVHSYPVIKTICLTVPLVLILSGCQARTAGEPFRITVRDSTGSPLEGVVIAGGIDWDAFRVTTDSSGQADLPGSAKGGEADIHLNNYFPKSVRLRWPYLYEMAPTPQRLRLLGDVKGKLARFEAGRLATVDYDGNYHLFAVDTNNLTEIAAATVPRLIRQTKLIDDTLWFSTQSGGIYAYSLADLEHPVEQLHVAIPGDTPVFALRNNVIAVGNGGEHSSIGVYAFEPDGSFAEMCRFFDAYVSQIAFIGDFLIVTNYYNAHPKIYDLSNPANPVLVWDAADPKYWSGFLYGQAYIQIPKWDQISEETVYGRLDLSNPLLPRTKPAVLADSRLVAVIDDETAVGYYHVLGGALAVLSGSMTTGFRTVALVSEDQSMNLNEFGGCARPFYVIGERLWILEERGSASAS